MTSVSGAESFFSIEKILTRPGSIKIILDKIENNNFYFDNLHLLWKNLTDKNNIDAIIVDEVQAIKTRDDDNISIWICG